MKIHSQNDDMDREGAKKPGRPPKIPNKSQSVKSSVNGIFSLNWAITGVYGLQIYSDFIQGTVNISFEFNCRSLNQSLRHRNKVKIQASVLEPTDRAGDLCYISKEQGLSKRWFFLPFCELTWTS